MSVSEFAHLSEEQLRVMLAELHEEADRLEDECLERNAAAVEMGLAYGNDPACDYVADDLRKRTRLIFAELRRREARDSR